MKRLLYSEAYMKRLWLIIILLLMITGCASSKKDDSQQDPSVLYKDAEEKLKKGRHEEAREALKKVMERDAEKSYSPIAQIQTADSFYDEGEFDSAIEEYKKFLILYPHNKYAGYAQYQMGLSHFKQIRSVERGHGHIEGAIKEFTTFLKLYPRHSFAEEARERLRICKDMASEHEFYVGNFYFKKGSYNAAAIRFENLIRKYPQSSWEADALYYLGISYKESGKIDKAKEVLTILTEHYPNYKHKKDAEKILSRLEGKN